MPVVVVDHHHRCPVARTEALHWHHREHARGVGFAGLDAKDTAQLTHDTLGARKRARQRGTHLQHVGADRGAVEHHVIRNDVLNFGRCTADDVRHVAGGIRRDIALLLLRQIQRMQYGRLAVLGSVVRGELLEACAPLGREVELGPLRQLGPLRAVPLLRAVGHRGMKAHRSTSPITTSSEPMTAMTSAIMPPTMNLCRAWQAMSPGERMCTRHGRLPPSDTT